MAVTVDAAEVRQEIRERGRAYLSEATGFDQGDEFTSEARVRGYFQAAEFRAVLGECPWTQEALDAMAEAVIDGRWHMATYEAYRYAADGCAGEEGDGAVVATGTLEECRGAIERRNIYAAGWTLDDMRWSGMPAGVRTEDDPGDVEAYHESDREGCGGWAIRRA